MPKCSNCGAELDAGAKFCMECGTPIPQTKKCVQCGMELPLKAKFCFGCGAPQEGNVSGVGVSMGDKNVIAGDVIGQKVAGDNVQNKIMGNAVFNTYQDDTKIVNGCAICGKHMTNDVGHTCPSCGKIVCKKHFDEKQNLCSQCIQKKKELAEQEYDSLLKTVYADGVVNPAERRKLNDLRKKLGISKEIADVLEMQYQSMKTDGLTKIENLVIQSVQDLLWNDINAAYQNITEVYKNHPSDEYVLTWYLRVARVVDSKKTLELIKQQKIDCEEACISLADINLEQNRLNDAEIALERCKQIWSNSFETKCYELYYLIMVSLMTNTDAYLDTIKSKMNDLPMPSDVYEQNLMSFIKTIQSLACKKEIEVELKGFWKKRFNRIKLSITQNTGKSTIRLNHDDVVCPQNKEELKKIIRETIKKNGCKCDLNFIDVSKVSDMDGLFDDSSIESYPDWYKVKVKDKAELQKIIEETMKKKGPNCDLNFLDVSAVTDMSMLFGSFDHSLMTSFNGNISQWNVSNVSNMELMFIHSQFNGDISQWDVSSVANMRGLFEGSRFNGNISQWNVSNVSSMQSMFAGSQFNGDISKWNVSNVTDMSGMFSGSQFTRNIDEWNVSPQTDKLLMFSGSRVEKYPDWYKIKVKDKKELVELIHRMIEEEGPSCDLNFIDVSNIKDMRGLFFDSHYTGYLTISIASFNGNISKWDVSNVTDMSQMFAKSPFNGDISQWNVSNVTDMARMFEESKFNGDISQWNVAKVADMNCMFYESQFNGDISKWCVSSSTKVAGIFDFSRIGYYPGWYKVKVSNVRQLAELIKETIRKKGPSCDLNFIDVSQIRNMDYLFSEAECLDGWSSDNRSFNGDISKWNVSNVTSMSNMFRGSVFNGDISKWDVSAVTDMSGMFKNAQFNGDISQWNVSKVKNMGEMFKNTEFDGTISQWNVSNVTNMDEMFSDSQFAGDISLWDVSNVERMSGMFAKSQFNGDISQWNVSNVTSMREMFAASRFNGDLSHWDMSKVETIRKMFFECSSFCGDVSSWKLKSKVDQYEAFEGSNAVHSKIASFVKRLVKK